jgi:hypothetical protein
MNDEHEIIREADDIVRELRRGPKREVRLPAMPATRRDAVLRLVRARLLKDR